MYLSGQEPGYHKMVTMKILRHRHTETVTTPLTRRAGITSCSARRADGSTTLSPTNHSPATSATRVARSTHRRTGAETYSVTAESSPRDRCLAPFFGTPCTLQITWNQAPGAVRRLSGCRTTLAANNR
ncbi:unnamed protein product [Trichogramma brassicae]|uniref:Uncharacterized protein n=1 Tax=Trichogramma brassicae TaxID=86971 RepID=A0A6H5IUQ9_9HYME|nr:unnamed protein product [Trichogramma brassicae]